MEKSVSGPFLGQLYYQESVIASCYFLLFAVDIISIAHRNAGCCGPPAPMMKAFRCLETCHFPQLCIPELRSDETCLYHSHDNLCIYVISIWNYTCYLCVYSSARAIMEGQTQPNPFDPLCFESIDFFLFFFACSKMIISIYRNVRAVSISDKHYMIIVATIIYNDYIITLSME